MSEVLVVRSLAWKVFEPGMCSPVLLVMDCRCELRGQIF